MVHTYLVYHFFRCQVIRASALSFPTLEFASQLFALSELIFFKPRTFAPKVQKVNLGIVRNGEKRVGHWVYKVGQVGSFVTQFVSYIVVHIYATNIVCRAKRDEVTKYNLCYFVLQMMSFATFGVQCIAQSQIARM